ncbi:hypothetical protein GO003_017820 [Methylicorpusculum oleiharenae]|uniref:hypothetical protein n=1 Tax=Methylicorpusculum oleiharenae TaxID=1338687 RepID=UPI00135B58E6|nr:hypothetical protein [Methylicorpusculum oleiharenae]MCD2452250.1 hypothetical protein [Methylicorpusculum oleiharenae]
MSKPFKALILAAMVGGLVTLTGCIVTPDGNQQYYNDNTAQNQTQHLNSQKDAVNAEEADRGCADAKVGSYDRSGNAGSGYEEGWQACNNNKHHNNQLSKNSKDKEWNRGCADAEAASYDRSGNAGAAYEEGWHSCDKHAKQQNFNRGDKEWNRGCSDAKNGNYDRSGNAGPTYEEGWQACNKKNPSGYTPAGGVEAAKQICLNKLGDSAHIQTISALKPGFWEIIMISTSGRKVACTADTAAGNVADWVEM